TYPARDRSWLLPPLRRGWSARWDQPAPDRGSFSLMCERTYAYSSFAPCEARNSRAPSPACTAIRLRRAAYSISSKIVNRFCVRKCLLADYPALSGVRLRLDFLARIAIPPAYRPCPQPPA